MNTPDGEQNRIFILTMQLSNVQLLSETGSASPDDWTSLPQWEVFLLNWCISQDPIAQACSLLKVRNYHVDFRILTDRLRPSIKAIGLFNVGHALSGEDLASVDLREIQHQWKFYLIGIAMIIPESGLRL